LSVGEAEKAGYAGIFSWLSIDDFMLVCFVRPETADSFGVGGANRA
jgi:hypothetical protein